MAREVTIHVRGNTFVVDEWGMAIGNPRETPLPSVMAFTVQDVRVALSEGRQTWPGHGSLTVSRAGIATATTFGHQPAVYELFPARFADDKPYEPALYIGRWPD